MILHHRSRLAILLYLLSAASSVLAGSGILGPGPVDFTPNGTQPRLQVPLDEPDACSGCHGAFDPGDSAVMPHATWSGSMMANATRDPLFWAALDVANHDVPGAGDFCLRCHTPTGWLGGRVRKTGIPATPTTDGTNGCKLTGSLTDPDSETNDFAGLTCHFCHRADDAGPQGQPSTIGNANLWIDDSLQCNTPDGGIFFGPCRKGPYEYTPGAGINAPPHGWEHSNYLGSSEFCGACHDVSTPDSSAGPLKTLILPNGTDSGIPFPIERTYSEWKASAFGDPLFADGFDGRTPTLPNVVSQTRSCQDCHMRNSMSPSARACVFEAQGSRTGDLSVHEFVGGNNWIPKILRDEYGLGRTEAFNRTIAWTEEMLSQRSATIETTIQSFAGPGNTLTARVRVTNLSGHKLPTGYSEGRRMWLNFKVTDGNGATVFESGAYNPATGTLTLDPQAKVYEVLQGQWNRNGNNSCDVDDGNGRKLFHFVLNNCVAKDNRIPPQGFRGGSSLELRPVGYTYPEVSPGVLQHWDDTSYSVPVPLGTALPLTVSATLRFQVASREYIEFLRDEAVNNGFQSENQMCNRSSTVGPANQTRAQYMFDLWQEYGRSPPFDMVSDSASTQGNLQ
ncbi:MAG: hypothetical protein JNL89_08135 [Rhodanobacteraceae bacterium]|nr:hypothetical protein [Rhodanobacteraceae bacterium]